jgi:hypothetical protein
MTTAKWTINTGEKQDLRYPAARFNEKGRLLVCGGGDALKNVMYGGVGSHM